jgi:hypothetical protein
MGTMERIAGTRTASPLSMFRDPAWCVALAAAIAFAIAVRGAMLFRGEVPAGVDAGYYAVQARELLLLGKLRWADVPLTFLLDAAVAKAAMLVCGWDIDTATVWATRVVDAAAEPLVAVAVFVAAWTFARGARGAITGAVAVAIAVTVGPPLLRMVGDFEKQSMAYVFMAGTWTCAWIAMRATDRRSMVRWAAAALLCLATRRRWWPPVLAAVFRASVLSLAPCRLARAPGAAARPSGVCPRTLGRQNNTRPMGIRCYGFAIRRAPMSCPSRMTSAGAAPARLFASVPSTLSPPSPWPPHP